MEIIVDGLGDFKNIEQHVKDIVSKGYQGIMIFHAEGGIDTDSKYKEKSDKLLKYASKNNVQIFGGIFPGIFNKGKLMSKGSIIAGIKSRVHIVVLENLNNTKLFQEIEEKIKPFAKELKEKAFKTVFVFGDGFGENNLNLINGLNDLITAYPVNIIGGMTGRDQIKSSHFTIFTPQKIIQNGAVLAFTQLSSGVGVEHGWEPLMESDLEITQINDCFVEKINNAPALDFYMHVISSEDKHIDEKKSDLIKDTADFFNHVAVKYPLGLIRKVDGKTRYIDRTPISVGADKSLQFSAKIPVGTKACILHLKGDSILDQCSNLTRAVNSAFQQSKQNFPDSIKQKQVLIMDCFGRKSAVEFMGEKYSSIEFKQIAADQKDNPHSPFGPLTFGEISSMEGGYVELHNKTAVVGVIEDN